MGQCSHRSKQILQYATLLTPTRAKQLFVALSSFVCDAEEAIADFGPASLAEL